MVILGFISLPRLNMTVITIIKILMVMELKNLIYLLLVNFIFITTISCKKDESTNIPPQPKKLTLYEIKFENNIATLNWSSVPSQYFKEYEVRRYYQNSHSSKYEIVASLHLFNDTTFIDSLVPHLPFIAYEIIGKLDNQIIINSNKRKIERPSMFVYPKRPFDVTYFKDIGRVYITEYYRKEIIVVNYKTCEYINTIVDSVTLGYICVGDNGFGPELYVPKINGKLDIYDALTLKKKIEYEIPYTTPSPGLSTPTPKIYSATTANKGNIYLSVDYDWSPSLKILSRDSLKISNTLSDREGSRLIYLQGKNSILEVTSTISPADANIYYLDAKGLVLSKKDDRYHGTYPLDDEVLCVSADKNYFITSMSATIYSTDLKYIGQLNTWGYDFETNDESSIIYVSKRGTERMVECYNYPDLEYIKSIPCIGYPYNVYLEKDTIYLVSSVDGTPAIYSDIMLEKHAVK